ncbi:transcriptional regulator [Mobilisporobacter senegalensis]|uniref:Transcriptional regulator n=1 Tax=Mobilisporobacter senegalensis TaxID=1329262 RepID=A0A3N1XL36_9FIRM|nr:transcriptional regulator [Mobilisporobacter senegalensis]
MIDSKGAMLIAELTRVAITKVRSIIKTLVTKEEKRISLSKKEGALLEFLLLHKETILTREQILNRAWGLNTLYRELQKLGDFVAY